MTSVVNLHQLPAERALSPPDIQKRMWWIKWFCVHETSFFFGSVDCVLKKPPRLLGSTPNDSTQNFRPARSVISRTFLFKLSEKRQFSGIRKLFWFPKLVSFESACKLSPGNFYLISKGWSRFFGYTSHKQFSHFFVKVELQHSPK